MYKAKGLFMFLTVLVFSANSLFAQLGSVDGTANVTLDIKPSLAISVAGGDLDFGQILSATAGVESKTPDLGVKFKVDGHSTGNITVTYGNATLTNATADVLTFIPSVVTTGSDPTYTGPIAVASTTQTAINSTVYLWVGGSIDATLKPEGDYAGIFTMTVAY